LLRGGLKEKPAAIALAWPRPDQDLKRYIDRAHDAGCKVTLMAGEVREAERGVADLPKVVAEVPATFERYERH
jgi:hypothetical protein